MIDAKELKYVGYLPNEAPYPGDEYALFALKKLSNALKIYRKSFNNYKFYILLSNGEKIKFSIERHHLCHLLGIDYKYILSDKMNFVRDFVLNYGYSSNFNSFDLINRIIDRASDVIFNDNNYQNERLLNYYRILLKCLYFEKIPDFQSFNFGIINFDKLIYDDLKRQEFKPKSNKFLFTKTNNEFVPFCFCGLVNNQKNNYISETLYGNEEFYNLFDYQELVLPIKILIKGKNKTTELIATPNDKLNLLKMYRDIIVNYQTNSYVNIYNDYENILKKNCNL